MEVLKEHHASHVAPTGASPTTSITSLHAQAVTKCGGLKSSSTLLSTAPQSWVPTGSASAPDDVAVMTYNVHTREALYQSVRPV